MNVLPYNNNISSKNQRTTKRLRPKAKINNRRVQRVPNTNTTQSSQSRSEVIGNAIKKNIEKAQHYYEEAREKFEPFSKYVHMLLHENSPKVVTPLTPHKVFLKRVYYQDTLQVNANGHACIVIPMNTLSIHGSTATASPVLYMNQAGYDPDATSGMALTGGWNTAILAGTNLVNTAIANARVASAHVSFQITGVSNLNKQGTIHMAETIESSYYIGNASDTQYNELALYRCAVPKLPKFSKYKSIEIVNMGPDSAIEYHYIPISNRGMLQNFHDISTPTAGAANSFVNEVGKVFNLTVRGAAAGTTIRARYEINFECDVYTDYINDYPPQYSRCFVDSEPTLCLLNQNEDYILRVNSKQGHIDKTLYRDVNSMNLVAQSDPLSKIGGLSSDPNVKLLMA